MIRSGAIQISMVLAATVSAIAESCPAIPNGIVINKYYLEECGACKRLAPVIEDIRSKLEKAEVDIKYREIECTECECEGISNFPTLEITHDKKVTGSTTGYKDYGRLSEWLIENLKLDKEIFEKHLKAEEGEVTKLVSRDFLSGFDGQWLILFYEEKNEMYREYMKQIATKYKNKIHVGEVNKQEAHGVTNRFNVAEYPAVFALNHGTAVPYTGDKNIRNLEEFAEKLSKPNFESISYNKLRAVSSELQNGEPLYVVLYKNYEIASHYFNDMAQQFKFRVPIYKSNDPAMFSAAGFHPKEMNEDSNYNTMVKLVLFKNGSFYPCPVPLEQGDEIIQWVFHTHFAHVTEINNDTFYTVFHGIKPVLILVSPGGQFLSEFNKLSADRHLGTPYLNIIFAYLDSQEYPNFMNHVLPKIRIPSLAFYDPVRSSWFVGSIRLSNKNFGNNTIEYIERYFNNKLPAFPPKKSMMSYYLIVAWAVLIVAFFGFRRYSERYKAE